MAPRLAYRRPLVPTLARPAYRGPPHRAQLAARRTKEPSRVAPAPATQANTTRAQRPVQVRGSFLFI